MVGSINIFTNDAAGRQVTRMETPAALSKKYYQMNSFGHNFRITLFGESHGEVVGVVIDGVKPGMKLGAEDFEPDLARRRNTLMPGSTSRREADLPHIVSGILNGFTTGAPVAILFHNEDHKSEDYERFAAHPRPSHADLTAMRKYEGFNDPRGGGIFSGRMTVGIVAAGVVAKKMLPRVNFTTTLTAIGGCTDPGLFDNIISDASAAHDSVGGIVRTVVTNLPAGAGEPFFDSAESIISHLLFSIPAVKGVGFGAGFGAACRKGSEYNDIITDSKGTTVTNNDGGINGGITNGNPLIVEVAIKPAPSISVPQTTYNMASGSMKELQIGGRHDACIAIRGAVAIEAAVAIALADLISQKDMTR